jgi:anti-sigma B factor antagonist
MPELLEVRVRREGQVGVLETDGYINNMGAEKVAEACDELIREGFRYFVLNLEKSRIINSIGISILIEVIEKVKELEGQLAFCCVTATIAKTFRIMGLLKASKIYETESDAVGELGGARE